MVVYNQEALATLVSMGVPEIRATKALIACNNDLQNATSKCNYTFMYTRMNFIPSPSLRVITLINSFL